MPGLLNAKSLPGRGADRQTEARPADDTEQAGYEDFVKNGVSLIHSKGGMRAMLELVGGGNPVEGLANALVTVLTRLVDTAAAQGVVIEDDVILQGGSELFLEMADLAEEAGVHEFSKDELEASLAFGLQLFTQMGQEKQQPAQGPNGPTAQRPNGPATAYSWLIARTRSRVICHLPKQ